MYYWELEVYKKAYALSLEAHKASLEFPKIEQFGGLASQMREASKSICANLAEGLGRFGSKGEERRGLTIAIGSCEETVVWLNYSRDLGYLAQPVADQWATSYREVARMLTALSKKRRSPTMVP
jgi:four helix bundle protein